MDFHPPIIEPEVFDLVQYEMKQRKASGKWVSAAHCFSGKIFCGECGSLYGSKLQHGKSKYKRMMWQCNQAASSRIKCKTPQLTDKQVQEAFIAVINKLIANKAVIEQAFKEMLFILTDNTKLEARHNDLQDEYDVVREMIRKLIEENATTTLDQKEYQRQYNSFTERYVILKERLVEINEQIQERAAKRTNMKRFMEAIKSQKRLITKFDEELWFATVKSAEITATNEMCFSFRDGSNKIVRL